MIIQNSNAQGNFDFEIGKNIDIYADLYNKLNTFYIYEIEPGQLNKVAIDAMLKSLDPYTNYYPESQITDVRFMQSGQYGGIGTTIGLKNGDVVIKDIFKDYPAHKAGLKVGDIIKEVDGVTVNADNYSEVTSLLKGSEGSELNLKIESPISKEITELSIERTKIQIKNVPFYKLYDNSTAYVKLGAFKQNASADIKKSIDELNKNGEVKSLILDLRSNPGGLLTEATNLVDYFVGKNLQLVETRGKLKDQNNVFKSRMPAKYPDMKVVVLIDERSASASEIVAGSLQDLDRAVVIGRKSFGKGLVQKVIPLSYNSQAKVTVSKYYIPSGRCIQAIDYAKGGKGETIADSLAHVFYTKNGRPVKDVGGILPDIEIEKRNYDNIIKELLTSYQVFDFVNYLTNKNSESDNLTLSDDKLFEMFLSFIDTNGFYSELNKIKDVENLKSELNLKTNESAFSDIKESYIQQQKEIIKKNKKEIDNLIRIELNSRYSFNAGRIEESLKSDKVFNKALEILNDDKAYKAVFKTVNN